MMKRMLPLFFVLVSCFQEDISPEAALKSFIESRIGHVITRDFVLERVTGKMRQSLENISEEEFQKFADLRNIEKGSFKILSKSCQEKTCFLTYAITYRTLNDKEKVNFTSDVKKIAEVVNENGKWLIADVSNIKTYHESLNPINP